MPFERGRRKTGGRQVGTPNRINVAFREAVQIVYEALGGHAAFTQWAQENPTEFYRIAARLIPGEMREHTPSTVNIIVDRSCKHVAEVPTISTTAKPGLPEPPPAS